MTTRADMSVVRILLTCYVHSSCMNAIAYAVGVPVTRSAPARSFCVLAPPLVSQRSQAHGTGRTGCFRDVVQSSFGRS